MWSNTCTAKNEMERRYEFVSDGAQNARWIGHLATERVRVYRDRLLQVAGNALLSLGTRLKQKPQLDSTHS